MRPARLTTRARSYVMIIDALATRASLSVDRGDRRSTIYARAARSGVYACVGTTVTAWPYRLATSFDTTMHVRVLRGFTPTDGSHWIHRLSPRRTSTRSRVFIVQQLQLPRLEVAQQCLGVTPPGR